jgi:cytochrome b561
MPPVPDRYVAPARWLHWLTAGCILVVAIAGIWLGRFDPKPEAFKRFLYLIHESFGATVFVLALARLWVRWRNPPPPLPEMPALMKLAAAATHLALYAVLIIQPVVGFLNTNAWGFPFAWFGLIPIPSPIGRSEVLAPILSQLHFLGALAMLVLLGMHIGAVIHHTFIRKDGLLSRMV